MILVDDTKGDDYTSPNTAGSSGYVTIPDGVYNIISVIFKGKSINKATEKPTPVVSSWGVHQVFYTLVTAEGKNIPLALDYRNIPYLVQAFTSDAANLLPPVPDLDNLQAVEEYLMQTRQLCDVSEKNPSVTLKGGRGWAKIYNIQGAYLPQKTYILKLEDITPLNSIGKPEPKPSPKFPDTFQFGARFGVHYNQVCKRDGWSGVSLWVNFLPYQMEIVTSGEGELVTDWIRYKGGPEVGNLVPKSKGFKAFVKACAPTLFTKTFELEQAGNILPELLMQAKEDDSFIRMRVEAPGNGFNRLDLETAELEPLSNFNFNDAYNPPPVKVPEIVKKVDHLEVLKMFFNLVEGDFVFPENTSPIFPIKYNPVQLEVLKKYIGSVSDKVTTNKTSELTLEDVNIIMSFADFSTMTPTVREAVAKLSSELETVGASKIVTEEEPF